MLTRREKIAVIWVVAVLIFLVLFPQFHKDDFEFLYLLLVVIPAGVLIATDKERLERMK